jgi:hypothetical protein
VKSCVRLAYASHPEFNEIITGLLIGEAIFKVEVIMLAFKLCRRIRVSSIFFILYLNHSE